jgi:hypothetical protein
MLIREDVPNEWKVLISEPDVPMFRWDEFRQDVRED